MDKKNSFLYKSISETDIMDDNQLDAIEAGACDGGCRKACLPGNQNAGNGNGVEVPELPEVPEQEVQN